MPGWPDNTIARAPCAGAATMASRSAPTSFGSSALTGGRASLSSSVASWRIDSSTVVSFAGPEAPYHTRAARTGDQP
jgi:hypothetical protein